MTSGPPCRCLLCRIENQLSAELELSSPEYGILLSSTANGLREFRSPSHLLSHLKATHADSSSDNLYRELLSSSGASSQFVETIMILAFVPLLHGTVRRIAKSNSHLTRADITQQALSVFLQTLRSVQRNGRQSHFVFAISRAVKRQLFDWAAHEGTVHGPARKDHLQAASPLFDDDWMERHALLGHFLHRCAASGLLGHDEIALLVRIKLDGNTGDEIAESDRLTSNAVRQRMKRLLAKLRRIAGEAGASG